jgi:hypothetical protein
VCDGGAQATTSLRRPAGSSYLWKTVFGFPRTGGRVLGVHGSGSVHSLWIVRWAYRGGVGNQTDIIGSLVYPSGHADKGGKPIVI